MKRIIFLNRFFFPDHSATSQILGDLAFHLAGAGHDVHVITSRQRYDQPAARLPRSETIDGVAVHRISGTYFGRTALSGRGLDYLSYYAGAWRRILAVARRGDILVAKTDPPLACVPAMWAAERRGLRLVNWLQDLYPEVAIELGVPFAGSQLGRVLYRLRDAALRNAAANAVVGEQMADRLRARGIAAESIHVIPNWCDDDAIRPLAAIDNPLRREWGLEDRFVIGYSGNLGLAHEFDTVLAAAEHLRNDTRFLFLCVGSGRKFDDLVRAVARRRLERSFRFRPDQERNRLGSALGVADVHWISLLPQLEGLVVPSKLYGIAAAGRPVIAITAADGEIATLVRRHDCGIVVAPGNSDGLAAALTRLAAAPDSLAAMGRRARAMLDTQYTRRHGLERWRTLLEAIA
jgi:colanic acid biosynthesis glycosyl transferase WcaI